jgi:hypothetical protein
MGDLPGEPLGTSEGDTPVHGTGVLPPPSLLQAVKQ